MITSSELLRTLGLTMVHSLWEGAVITALILLVAGFIPKTSARSRYTVMLFGLLLLLAAFCTTLFMLYRHHSAYGITGKNGFSELYPPVNLTGGSFWSFIENFTDWLTTLLEPYYPFLALCWITGFVITGIQTTGGLLFTRNMMLKDTEFADTALRMSFDRLKHLLRVTQPAKIRVTQRMVSPMVIGFLKPVIILPVAAVSGLSSSQLEAVIIHELAHIRRYDHLIILFQAFARQVLFFHPAVWYLNREIERERENCCDDLVIQTQNNSLNYIKALTMIQEMNLNGLEPANALTTGNNRLLNRIERLIRPEQKHSSFLKLSGIFLFLATVGVSAMTLMISGKNPVSSNLADNNKQFITPSGTNADSSLVSESVPLKNREIESDKDGVKKKMKIVMVDDTIQEMTVNGRKVDHEEMKKYQDDIGKMQQELKASQRELESVNNQLKDAQRELEFARQRLNDGNGHFNPELSELNRQLRGTFSQLPEDLEHAREVIQSEEFREQMKKAQTEAAKVFEEARKMQQEYWYQHQDELKEQIRKAQEEGQRAVELFREQRENLRYHREMRDLFPPCPPIPPDVAIPEPPVVPNTDQLTPEIPIIPEIPAIPPSIKELDESKDSGTKQLNSQLRELEEE